MRRRHDMPFGATLLPTGEVRFGLWAPAARRVELALSGPGGDATLELRPNHEGWFFLETDRAVAGTLYRFRVDGNPLLVPDPASRHQPQDVHGPSQVVDPAAFAWTDDAWHGRPWHETVLYELHVGTFTPAGTFAAAMGRLPALRDIGITAVELMPVADFPGRRNWGYDGVLPFAPDGRYGSPEELKAFVQEAHRLGLMVFMDVVYNHFGPEGNYLHLYAPQFFTERHQTPWGAGINFDGDRSHWVRQFFIHNALYWIEEYHVDGLRLDAVHAIADDSRPDILQAIAEAVNAGPALRRHVHLVLENERNQAHYLERSGDGTPLAYTAQWNDDIHHALHVLLSGETGGYYADFAQDPVGLLGRCLTEGFAFQGDPSAYRHGELRGEPSAHLPPTAFVSFLENHDQIGNRAFGDRPTARADAPAAAALTALLLLAPQVPLLFMGQEWRSRRPFPFFCDFGPELAAAVTEGRRREFARFPEFSDPQARARIPDPMAEATFAGAVLDADEATTADASAWLERCRELLRLRREVVQPRLAAHPPPQATFARVDTHALMVRWRFADGATLRLLANLGGPHAITVARPAGRLLYAHPDAAPDDGPELALPPWSTLWFLYDPHG